MHNACHIVSKTFPGPKKAMPWSPKKPFWRPHENSNQLEKCALHPKTTSKRLKTTSRQVADAPRPPQDASEAPTKPPRHLQDRPKHSKTRPRHLQIGWNRNMNPLPGCFIETVAWTTNSVVFLPTFKSLNIRERQPMQSRQIRKLSICKLPWLESAHWRKPLNKPIY